MPVLCVAQHHDELVAAHAGHDVRREHALHEAARHLAQQHVAGLVAQRIVHRLEVVQVDEQHGRGLRLALRGVDHGGEPLHERGAVGQPRERIVPCQEGFALLGLAARGDVAQHGDAVARALPGHGLADDLHGHGMAVLVQHRDLVGLLAVLAHGGLGEGAEFLAHEIEHAPAAHLAQRVAHQPRERLVEVGDEAIAVEHDRLFGGLRELAHALFAFAHRALGLPVVCDVVDQHERAQQAQPRVQVGDEVHLHHARRRSARSLLAGVLHALASQHLLDLRLDRRPGRIADGLLRRLAQDGFDGVARGFGIALVGENATQRRGFEVREQRRNGVGQQPQQGTAAVGVLDRTVRSA